METPVFCQSSQDSRGTFTASHPSSHIIPYCGGCILFTYCYWYLFYILGGFFFFQWLALQLGLYSYRTHTGAFPVEFSRAELFVSHITGGPFVHFLGDIVFSLWNRHWATTTTPWLMHRSYPLDSATSPSIRCSRRPSSSPACFVDKPACQEPLDCPDSLYRNLAITMPRTPRMTCWQRTLTARRWDHYTPWKHKVMIRMILKLHLSPRNSGINFTKGEPKWSSQNREGKHLSFYLFFLFVYT